MGEVSERRRFPRYLCTGSADVFQGGQQTLWGTVSDIGRCGCYVEIATPLAVGTEVKLCLSITDFRLNIRARVACLTPLVGMGMEFLDASREQENLLAQIIQKVTGDTASPVLPPAGAPQPRPSSVQITREAAPAIFAMMVKHINEKGVLTKEELMEMVKKR